MNNNNNFLAAHLPVQDLAIYAVSEVYKALNKLREAQSLNSTSLSDDWLFGKEINVERIAAAFRSDQLFRINGEKPNAFAELSGFFETRDGWVRTHANYPHHRQRLCKVAELPLNTDRTTFVHRLRQLSAQEIENRAYEYDAIAVRVRREDEWRNSAQGLATMLNPLVKQVQTPSTLSNRLLIDNIAQPLAGIRVLDFTRVIAGPVATRILALLGANVIRVDSPRLPEIAWQHADTGQGKKTVNLDLTTSCDYDTARHLLDTADVIITGYRPGSIERLGLRLPEGIIHASINAWGEYGEWADRRGFDSIVQAVTGISFLEGESDVPGALPAQALDHASGYLIAASVIDAIARQITTPMGMRISVSLARTACRLLDAAKRTAEPHILSPISAACCATNMIQNPETDCFDTITTSRPVLVEYDDYPFPAHHLGSDLPVW